MQLSNFKYTYPKTLIAQHPLPERDMSRMMVLNRRTLKWEHRSVRHLPDYLQPGDLLVLNNTKVFPARLFGQTPRGKDVEVLLLDEERENVWRCLIKSLKKVAEGDVIVFGESLSGRIQKKEGADVSIHLQGNNVAAAVESVGLPPLPPYIRRKTKTDYSAEDKERYQSVFAEIRGSAAAPTASLHFSNNLLRTIENRRVNIAYITLHVSADTFLPVRSENILEHRMHGERFAVPKETQTKIASTKKRGGRIIAVGTTVVRALESDWSKTTTRLYITPGFEFKIVDGMLTNFHQPESTLILLVSAFAGKTFLKKTYKEAVSKEYRLFSFGDGMLIL